MVYAATPSETNGDGVLPGKLPDLLIRPLGDDGRYVVKNPRTGEYFQIGPKEAFILEQLDGSTTADEASRVYQERFGEPLSKDDLAQFLSLAATQGLVEMPAERVNSLAAPSLSPAARSAPVSAAVRQPAQPTASAPQSLLFWRKRMFDPDRAFTLLERPLRFLWTPTFLVLSATGILAAAIGAWAYGGAWLNQFPQAMRWETIALAWIVILFTAICHECAHGLTCKHFGGEVREVGFLLVLLMPGLYCNVSDAWLFREKSKRLWVTFAGAYCDLVLWAVAVGVWRLTLEETFVNYLAWVVVSVTGIRALLNLLPLLKLDGYYLLSDALEIPNLRDRSLGQLAAYVRSLLWGAPWPRREPRGGVLLAFGIGTWVFSVAFLCFMVAGLSGLAREYLGSTGVVASMLLGGWLMLGLVQGFSAGEVATMLRSRRWRLLAWLAAIAGIVAALSVITIEDRYGGPFTLRPIARAEVRAPVAGFVTAVSSDQGDAVSPGKTLIRLEVPDLATRLTQKRAEIREAEAELRLLEAGTRAEELEQLEARAKRATSWKELAQGHLERERTATEHGIERLGHMIEQRNAEMVRAQNALERDKPLLESSAISLNEYEEDKAIWQISQAQWYQAQSERKALEILGPVQAERELILREQDLAAAEMALALKQLPPRAEELEAARARLARLRADLGYLEGLERKQQVASPVAGAVITPRPSEQVGRYVVEGDLICEVEDRSAFEVEIRLPEQDAARIAPGRRIGIKLRALPYDSFPAKVLRIAPTATAPETGESQSRVPVFCRIDDPQGLLRSHMTGYARIYCDERPVGEIALDRAIRFVRTEFWW